MTKKDYIQERDFIMEKSEYKYQFKVEVSDWWFVAKRNKLIHYINTYLKKESKILDMGCGTGIIMKKFQNLGFNICGIDKSSDAISFCKKRGLNNVKLGDGNNIPFENEKFDIVIALDILEHVDDDSLVLKEMNRVLKKGGKLIISVPAFKFLWTQHDIEVQHKRRYAKSNLESKIIQSGFKIKRINFGYVIFFLVLFISRIFSKKIITKSLKTNQIFNKILIFLLWVEDKLSFIPYPFGTSIYCLAEKQQK